MLEKEMRYPLHAKVLQSDLEGVRDLLLTTTEIDDLDELGQSPLHWAVFRGEYEIAEALLQAGANPNIIAKDGASPRSRAKDFGLYLIEDLIAEFGGRVEDSFMAYGKPKG